MIAHPFFLLFISNFRSGSMKRLNACLNSTFLEPNDDDIQSELNKEISQKKTKTGKLLHQIQLPDYIIAFEWHTHNHVKFTKNWHLPLPADMMFFLPEPHMKNKHTTAVNSVSQKPNLVTPTRSLANLSDSKFSACLNQTTHSGCTPVAPSSNGITGKKTTPGTSTPIITSGGIGRKRRSMFNFYIMYEFKYNVMRFYFIVVGILNGSRPCYLFQIFSVQIFFLMMS